MVLANLKLVSAISDTHPATSIQPVPMSIPAMTPSTKALRWAALAALTLTTTAAHAAALITNGDFETGNFTGWITSDLSSPYSALAVHSGSTWGGFSAQSGFDGNGPGTIAIAQDIGVLSAGSSLSFDYSTYAQMARYGSSTDRVFSVSLSPFGGGTPIHTFEVFRALSGIDSYGNGPISLDFAAYAGQNVRLSFELFVPESYTGPGGFELDNVTLTAAAVPEPAEYAAVTGLALGVFALVQRRRQAAGR